MIFFFLRRGRFFCGAGELRSPAAEARRLAQRPPCLPVPLLPRLLLHPNTLAPRPYILERRYGEHSRQRLDLALLSFFQNFRKVYVGEQVRPGTAMCYFF